MRTFCKMLFPIWLDTSQAGRTSGLDVIGTLLVDTS